MEMTIRVPKCYERVGRGIASELKIGDVLTFEHRPSRYDYRSVVVCGKLEGGSSWELGYIPTRYLNGYHEAVKKGKEFVGIVTKEHDNGLKVTFEPRTV